MINNINNYIKVNNLIKENDIIYVALSGGADSTCLLHTLLQLKQKYNLNIKAIHINHMIRGEEANRDMRHCKTLCNQLNVELLIKKIDVVAYKNNKKITLEQAGREIRYREFSMLEGKVALGHNKNDNVETILMNILRGSSGEGLKGIKIKNNKYIRPLLDTYRSEIETYCVNNNLKYVIDSTNNEDEYFRNSIRNQVIPLLNKITNKDINENILRLSKLVGEDTDFINEIASNLYAKVVSLEKDKVVIDNIQIVNTDNVLIRKIIRKAIKTIKGNLVDIEFSHTQSIIKMIKENLTGKKINLPNNISVLIQFNKTYVYEEKENTTYEYVLNIPGDTIIPIKNMIIKTTIVDKFSKENLFSNIQYFNYDYIKDKLHIRNRREGDVIKPYKGNGSKKLKKYFIDKKIDRFLRNDLLLIAEGKNIIYIYGYEYNKDYIPTNNHKILRVEFLER